MAPSMPWKFLLVSCGVITKVAFVNGVVVTVVLHQVMQMLPGVSCAGATVAASVSPRGQC